jgi:anti-sigma factor RsiW
VLDELSDKEAELKPRVPARSGDAEDSARHLSYGDLEAYVGGTLPAARMSYCGGHLESCEACRAELEDLRTFKSESPGLARVDSSRLELGRRKQRRGRGVTAAAFVTTVLVAIGGTTLWWVHWKASPVRPHPATKAILQNAQPVAPQTAPHPVTSPPVTAQAAVPPETVAPVTLPRPTPQPVAHSNTPVALPAQQVLPAAPVANDGFSLLSPVGESTSETRPVFRWQPLPGAIGYSVVVVDAGLHRVQRSPAIRSTSWRPRRPLHRGQTYLWQVTATIRGGSKVVAAAGPTPALVQIIQTPQTK